MKISDYCFDGEKVFNIKETDTKETGNIINREEAIKEFIQNLREINTYQQKLYAERKEGIVFIFQAMDAAGKDGVIRTVFSTLSPHGVREYCFKAPSNEELNHDFLWRFWSALPARGNISIFNRSYYEDVLVGKVHKLYKNQILPKRVASSDIIENRYKQIKDYEEYLYNTGTRVVKIFLNVSSDEQGKRFISRIDTTRKNWKISVGDIEERKYWNKYMEAFETMINVTSTKESPWYVVPADHKWYARLVVSRIILKTLKEIDPEWPKVKLDDDVNKIRQEILDSMKDKDLTIDKGSEIFNTPNILVEDMLEKEEIEKIKEKNKKTVENGMKAVHKLMLGGYTVNSSNDIVDIVAKANKNEEENKNA